MDRRRQIDDAPKIEATSRVTAQTAHTPRGHVLLIEDEPNIAEAIGFILARDNWQVSHHGDGAGALERARDLRPELIVLDYMLPSQSGIDILTALRGEPWCQDVPILMLTARGLERDREAALAAGASHFMTKPFSNAEIVATLRSLIANAPLLATPEKHAKHEP